MKLFDKYTGILLVLALFAGLLVAGISCTGETTTTTSSPTATQPPVTTTPPAVTTTPASTDVSPLPATARFRVATTTSLYDTGLWGYLEPMFEKKYDVEVDILSLGSGAAFEYGK